MDGVISDHKLLAERAFMQNEGIPIEHSQMSLDKYLDRLSPDERDGLLKIVKGISHVTTEYFRRDDYLFALLGIGTTTYSDEHWAQIEEYAKIDPSKKRFVEKKGEDIDLMFCPDSCITNNLEKLENNDYKIEYAKRFNSQNLVKGPHRYNVDCFPKEHEIFFKRKNIKKKIDKTGIRSLNDDEKFIWNNSYDFLTMITGLCIEEKWRFTPWLDYAPFGVTYIRVPPEFVEKEGQTYMRMKGEQVGVANMTLKIPGCRRFHIYVDDVQCISSKIEYERRINIPFSVIYRPETIYQFLKAIAIKNGTYTPTKEVNIKDMNPWKLGDELPI